jgi:lysophospholipase L1-like esterase
MKKIIVLLTVCAVSILTAKNVNLSPEKPNAQPLLPPVIYAVPGVEMNVFFRNIVLRDDIKKLRFKTECKVGKTQANHWTITPDKSQAGRYPFSVTTLDVKGKKLGYAQSKLVITPANAGKNKNIKLLIVGDSLTHASTYANRLAELLSKPGNPNWKMLGTHRPKQCRPNVFHEGYGGKTWKWFTSHYEPKPDGTYRKKSSPFVFLGKSGKPELDFQRYLKEKCNGEKPDYITVLLGINDCFSSCKNPEKLAEPRYKAMFKYADIMISEFRKVCPNAKIGICITPPANSRQEAFQANYKGKFNRKPWKLVQFELDKRIIEKFKNLEKENIYLIPVELNLDITKGFPARNAVHPNKFGYTQIGDSIYCWLKAML